MTGREGSRVGLPKRPSSEASAKRLLMIDNYDSFTYNLVQYLGELGAEVDVRRNDAITLEEVATLRPDAVVISPGPSTVTQVHTAIYRREDAAISTFGAAALTSMFWFGENTPVHHPDLRPEVHDSDGLLMERGNGEWIWRPLVNPSKVQASSFSDENPRGFGLVQRDRHFESYEDTEAAYNLRPSVWVEPIGSWGKGAVRLIELPTPDETQDNIVAFWVPATLPPVGQPFEAEYKLHWFLEGKAGAIGRTAFCTQGLLATAIAFSKSDRTLHRANCSSPEPGQHRAF